jgi:YidC/Oxa1 family membrane protein insertase
LLNPLYIAVSWVLLRWHDLFKAIGLDPNSGVTWALSIAFLVVTIRILLFRFFIKQVHSQRKMQEVQPKIAALREKYKNDRQTLSQEMMKLQKEEGFNPLGGCLPILLQAPVFLALFHVLRLIGTDRAGALSSEYGWSVEQVVSAGRATLFGAPIASAFNDPRNLAEQIPGASPTATKIVAGVLIVLMVAATYITQRQIISRNTQVLDSQQAMIQKLMLYGVPASLAVSGFFFPIGVLLYWFTNNLWTMGQQFYILKRMPHPNAKKDEGRPSVDGKLLAPKPGQKPVRPPRGRPTGDGASASTGSTGASDSGAADSGAADAGTGDSATSTTGASRTPPAKAPRKAAKAGRSSGGEPGGDAAGGKRVDGSRGADAAAADTDGAKRTGQPPAKSTGDADRAAAGTDGKSAGVNGSTAAGAAAGGTDGEEEAAGDGSGTPTPATPRGGKPTGSSGNRPRGNRRPQGQRSPTQTRQKKKRR